MYFALLTLFCALSISAIAAYFSIIGLATIFPGSTSAVIIMGAVLEVGKIAAAVWLHRNWKDAPRLIKTYLTGAVIVLMGITSMGIFGFLSKAHIEHQHTMDKSEASINQIDEKIGREKEYISRQKELIEKTEQRVESTEDKSEVNIKREQQKIKDLYEALERSIQYDREELKTLQERLDALNKEVADLENSKGGIFSNKKKKLEELKERQKEERELLAQQMLTINTRIQEARSSTEKQVATLRQKIEDYQKSEYSAEDNVFEDVEKYNLLIAEAMDRIDEFDKEKFTLKDDLLEVEAEVGPIKYVAALITDTTGRTFDNSQAVRLVIIVLIFVFDPLAILLVIAANISLIKHFPKLSINSRKLTEKEIELKNTEKKLNKQEELLKKRKLEINKEIESLSERDMKLNESREKIGEKLAALNDDRLDLDKASKEKLARKESLELEINELIKDKEKIEDNRNKLSGELNKIEAQIKISKEENNRLFGLTETISAKYKQVKETINKKALIDKPEISKIVEKRGNLKILIIKSPAGRVHEFSIPLSHAKLKESDFERVVGEMDSLPNQEAVRAKYDVFIKRLVTSEYPTHQILTVL